MDKFITTNIIVAEKIELNKILNNHSIHNVLNSITIPIVPSAVVTHVLLKYSNSLNFSNDDAELVVWSPDDEIIYSEILPNFNNVRKTPLLPGIDISMTVRFPVLKTGCYLYSLYVAKQLLNQYPLFILCS